MRKPIISLLVLGSFLSWNALAADVQVKEGAPDRYVVEKGDTLWGISGKFLNEPWRWPEIWQLNKDQIKDPHWIYPGDVVALDRSGSPHLRLVKSQKYNGRDVITVSPAARVEPHPETPAIPTISPADIGPFLSQPLVIEAGGLDQAPKIVASEENRVVIGAGNRAYVTGLREGGPLQWQVFRPGKAFIDPDTNQVLGYEAIYLGEAKVTRFGDPSTIELGRAVQEIHRGDRLVRLHEAELTNFVPHAPDKPLHGRIMTVYAGVAEAGPQSIVSINRGTLDGVERGQVLAIWRYGPEVPVEAQQREEKPMRNLHQTQCLRKDSKITYSEPYDPDQAWGPCPEETPGQKGSVRLPDERYGLMLVFRTFDHVSYALVMQAGLSVHQGDVVTQP
jgi:hypothetical protein